MCVGSEEFAVNTSCICRADIVLQHVDQHNGDLPDLSRYLIE